jgi:hypothetical protein
MKAEGKPAEPGNRVRERSFPLQRPKAQARGHHGFGDQLAALDQGWGARKAPD